MVPPDPLFLALAETISNAVFLYRGSTILYANRAAEILTGYPRADLLGKELVELIHPDYRRRVLQRTFARQRREEVPERYQFRIVTRTGEERWVDFTGRAIDIDDGPAAIGTWTDITDDRHGAAVLLDAEQRYADIFENSVEGIHQADGVGCLITANPSLARILGYASPQEMMERASSIADDLFVDPKRHEEIVRALASDGSVRRFDAELKRSDSRVIAVSINANAVFDAGLSLVLYNAFLQDVTEQRLLERRLTQAQKMEAIGRLAGGIAHDFNNILTALMGYSESLLMILAEGQEGVNEVREIKAAAQRAAMLTQQLLAFSRQQVARPVVLDMNLVIRGMEGMLKRLIGEDIELSTDACRAQAWVRADPHQVEQIVMNLVLNARDAMPGGGTVRIATGRHTVDAQNAAATIDAKPGDYVELTVTDTGTGMSPEVLSQIFEPFFTTKPLGKGTGLGLSTVFGIVQQAGGFITVDSTPGKGSCFRVYLPREEGVMMAPTPGSAPLSAPVGGETVIAVEDDPNVRAIIRGILSSAGYRVHEAEDGQAALALVEALGGAVDVIVTDVIMPRMGGRELVKALRTDYPYIPVLYVSGYEPREQDELTRDGPGFLSKPFTREDLLAAVHKAILTNS